MKVKTTILGTVLVLLGIGLFIYYDYSVRPEREAGEMLAEAQEISQRGDKESVNQAINLLTKVIVKYPGSRVIPETFYQIGMAYEKIGLNRLAYLKYSYIIKNNSKYLTEDTRKEVLIRLARINVLKQYSEEGVHQLLSLLDQNFNNEMRSRIYSELGHTYLKLGDYRRSKRMFDLSLTEHGSNEDAIVGKARAYSRLGAANDAFDTYEYFLKYYGPVSQYTGDVRESFRNQLYSTGLSSFRRGDYDSAVSYFSRFMRDFPESNFTENALYWTGESYFAVRKFDTAIDYFNRVLANGYYHKDQDAQIKKGYAYFMSKRFDLAAREFQAYLRNYPTGQYAVTAREWKNMSTKELLYRIEEKKLPDADDEKRAIKPGEKRVDKPLEDEEVAGKYLDDRNGNRLELENVAEL